MDRSGNLSDNKQLKIIGLGEGRLRLNWGIDSVNNDQSEDHDQDAAILNFEVDDVSIELAATGVGTIPTASVNMVPPNCCVQQKP
ncbi:MAG: hypothetical protein WAV38_37155 [Xanthobacteraceae bacterium]